MHPAALPHHVDPQWHRSIAPRISWAPPVRPSDGHACSTKLHVAAARPLQIHKHTDTYWCIQHAHSREVHINSTQHQQLHTRWQIVNFPLLEINLQASNQHCTEDKSRGKSRQVTDCQYWSMTISYSMPFWPLVMSWSRSILMWTYSSCPFYDTRLIHYISQGQGRVMENLWKKLLYSWWNFLERFRFKSTASGSKTLKELCYSCSIKYLVTYFFHQTL